MRSFRHITPRYVYYRLINIWYHYRHPNHPWLTSQAITILRSWLQPTDVGIEWGSGQSTVWFASRVKRLISIEHDLKWYQETQKKLVENGYSKKVDYHLISVNQSQAGSNHSIPYTDVVCEFPDESLDFALVDGKSRYLCMGKVVPKLRKGGILVLDNSERYVPTDARRICFEKYKITIQFEDEWDKALQKLTNWRSIGTTNGVWCTRFWIKPS